MSKLSSEKFESLEDDLSTLLDDLKTKTEQRITSHAGEQRKSILRQAERSIEEANLILQEMEDEAKRAPFDFRTQQLSKIRNYRRDLDQIGKTVKKAGNSYGGTDNYGFDRDDRMEASQRARLMQGAQSLNRTTESIARSHQISAQTDEIGTEVIDELGRQRETLERTRERLIDTDSNLGKSRKILRGMAMRVMTNKMILIVIILLELGILGGVVYWKFFSKK